MKLSGYNQKRYEEQVLKPYKQNQLKLKKYNIASITLLLLFILSIFSLKSNYLIIFAAITLTLSPFVFIYSIVISLVLAIEQQAFKKAMWLGEHPDIIEICEDFHIEIQSEQDGHIIIKNIRALTHNIDKGTMDILGTVYKKNATISKYSLSTILEDIQLIEMILQFSIDLKAMQGFKNTTLKDVIHMQSLQKNKLFVDELMTSQFLLPIRLLSEFASSSNILTIKGIFAVEYHADEQNTINLYTSLEEVSQDILNNFKRCMLIDFDTLCDILLNNRTFIFKETAKHVLINPQSDQVRLSTNQIKKMKEIGR